MRHEVSREEVDRAVEFMLGKPVGVPAGIGVQRLPGRAEWVEQDRALLPGHPSVVPLDQELDQHSDASCSLQ